MMHRMHTQNYNRKANNKSNNLNKKSNKHIINGKKETKKMSRPKIDKYKTLKDITAINCKRYRTEEFKRPN